MDDRTGKYYPVVKAVLGPASRRLWRTKITGLENIPDYGGAIIAPNHISFLDSLLLMGILPRQILFVGKAEYLDDWKTKYLFPATGMIPIDRSGGKASTAALDAAASVLDSGRLFGIYPEGTRSRSGKLHKGRTGVARLALRTGAPVIPVGIVGTDKIQPPDAPFPKLFQRCEFNFGEPISPRRYAKRQADARTYREFTDEILFEIRELSGQEYIHRYAGQPEVSPEDETTASEALRQ
ncbi:MAG: 1-acyl-sn-glycerol-3-phosphate acyltransferase [Actinomycetia bacterium]|nr:1-acyl-sn-glycerol-3-phosphate acyltransferase [Actinomycetes bacterium]MCP4961490.1 1-acyl-sn-glycerol-3-phosphate acyltransferase [Actinomycetes bacterium]